MPVYELSTEIIFPHPLLADDSGLLAYGGDLSPERLLVAYRHGIFPWYSEEDPILWHAPNPRFVLFPEKIKVSKSMKQVLRSGKFSITVNKDFKSVISNCQQICREGEPGTWITNEMLDAYVHMHKLGFAHSIEVWEDGGLVGGLYGINLGTVFMANPCFIK